MKQPLVSVIVPVYKAENTIRKCIDSLLAQTLKEFEIILVDDGSPDQCGEICDDYAQKDSRIKVLHQKNMGVSVARQAGIDNATGEYTIHADPDDWVEPTELEELYKKAKEDNADMVICDFYENDDIYHKQEPSSLDSKVVLYELFQQLHGSCCNKLVLRACYSNYCINFPKDIHLREDVYVLCAMLLHPIKVSYLSKAFYHYVQRPTESALSHSYDESSYQHDIRMEKYFDELLKDVPFVYERMKEVIVLSIIGRAFFFGGYYYDSHRFKECFCEYRKIVWSKGGLKGRLFIYPSCIGLHRCSYCIYTLLFNFKYQAKRLGNVLFGRFHKFLCD